MRNICILLLIASLVFAGCSSTPTNSRGPKTLSDIAAAAVVLKHAMAKDNTIPPEERWRYIAYSIGEDMESLGFNDEQVKRFAKNIMKRGPYSSMEEEILAVRARYEFVFDPNQM